MRNTRTASRLLALALTVLMLASCFVALPTMAEETATNLKTVHWSYDFKDAGTLTSTDTNPGASTRTVDFENGYFSKNDIFALTGPWNAGVTVSDGMMETGYQAKFYANGVTTGSNPNSDFNQLLYGIHKNFNTVGQTTFFEMDFKRTGTPSVRQTGTNKTATWSYTDPDTKELVEGSGQLYTDYNSGSGGNFFYNRGGGSEGHFLRVNAQGYAYTADNSTTSVSHILALEDGIYWKDSSGNKYYLPEDATITDHNLGYVPEDLSEAYYLELNVLYRLGVHTEITRVTTNTNGDTVVTVVNTIYIKKAGATNWETCIGTSTHSEKIVSGAYVFTNTSSGKLAMGGEAEIYTYACDGKNHLNVLETPSELDASVLTLSCIDCDKSWQERLIDGVYYTGVATAATCDKGSYMIWVPKNGVGTAFADSAYTAPATGHTYNSSGVCTACRKQEFAGYLADGFYVSGASASQTTVPGYTTTDGRGYIARSNNGKIYLYADTAKGAYKLGDRTKPFTISFDLMLDDVFFRSDYSGSGSFMELVSLAPNTDSNPDQLLAVGMSPDGTPFLSLAYDFIPTSVAKDIPSSKTTEQIVVALIDDGSGNKIVDPEDANYDKLMMWLENCAAPGHANTNAVGGAVTDSNGNIIGYNYFTVTDTDATRTYLFHNPQVGAYTIPEGEWFNVQITVVPDTAASENQAAIMLYVNGELITMRPQALPVSSAWEIVRFGQGANRFTGVTTVCYDNIGIRVHDTMVEAYTAATTEAISLAFDRFQMRRFDTNYNTAYLGCSISSSATRIGAFQDALDDDLELFSNAKGTYAYYSDTGVVDSDRLTVSLSTKLGGSDAATGTRYNVISDHKYEINTTLAISEDSPIYGTNQDGSEYAVDMIRLSKFRDAYVKVVLLGLNRTGYVANGAALYGYNEDNGTFERVSPYTTVTNNVPEAFSNVRVVVDEEANAYSVYVDDKMTYYHDNGSYKPYLNMPIPAPSGTGVTQAKAAGSAFTGDVNKYHDYTAAYFDQLITDGVFTSYQYACEYLCLFQSWSDFYLKDVSVSVIPDSKVEMIGVQEQVGDNSFDLRFVAGIDDIYVQNIDFEVKAYYNDSYEGVQNVSVAEVFSSVKETSGSMYAYECTEGEYLAAFKVVGMERTGASNRYKFVVTPTTTLADGTTVEGDSFTVVYDGEGRYLGNDKPFDVDLSQYEDLGTKPVMLELHAKSGEGDYEDFYIYTRCSDASGRYYVRYRMTYYYDTTTKNDNDTATNLNSFRINGAELVKVNAVSDTAVSYTKLHSLLSSGEISLAIKEYQYGQAANNDGSPKYDTDGTTPVMGNAIQDFVGGFHGDEHIVSVDGEDQISLKVGETTYVPGAENKLVQCDTVTFDMTTKIDRWNVVAGGANEQIVTHEQSFTFTQNGMAIDRKITWLVDDFAIDSAYPMMFTLLRLDGEDAICEIVETFDADGNSLGKETLALHNTERQQSILQNADLRKVEFSSATSGISAVASFTLGENNDGVLSSPYIAYRKDGSGADNKLYVPMKGGTNVTVEAESGTTTKTRPALGDVWEISTFYNIDYQRPAN